MSVRSRLTICFTGLFGALVIALALTAYLLVKNDAYLRLDAALQVAASATAMSAEHELSEHSTQSEGERDLQSVLEETGSSALADTQILVRDGSRNVAYKPGTKHDFDLRTVSAETLRDEADSHGFRIATRAFRSPKFNAAYQIYSARPIAPALAALRRIRAGLLILIPLGLGLAGLAGHELAGRSLQPLKDLAQTVNTVTSSDLSARVKPSRNNDEIGILGLRFNSLLDRLEEAFQIQRRFMADASHQIRTPVTVALAAAQVTSRDSNANLRDCQDALQTIEQQMRQLRRTVEDMFFLCQADTAARKPEQKEMYLDDAISDALRAAKALAHGKQQTLKLSRLAEAGCLGDEDLLKQAVLILLENAVKYTPPEGTIEAALFRRGGLWVCSVADSGIGISEAAQDRIFERFFRECRPDYEATTGAGLGLAIAKTIVESHGGTLALVESRPGRTIFEIAVPVLEANTDDVYANSLAVRI